MFNFFDLFALIVTVGLAVAGFREGFVRQALKLAGFVATIVLIALFSGHIINALSAVLPVSSPIIPLLVFIGIILASSLVFHFIAHVLHALIKITPVVFLDAGAGCLMGMLKALFLNGFLAVLLSFSPPGTFLNDQYTDSRTAGAFRQFLGETFPVIKSSIAPLYRKYLPGPGRDDTVPETPVVPDNGKQPSKTVI